jgi:hypothetical protein
MMEWVYNDGGRSAAGYKGKCGDCVTRSVAIVSGLPYKEVYAVLAKGEGESHKAKGKTARNGIHTKDKWFKDYMKSLGFVWVPTMRIGSGCTVHLNANELPAGKLIVKVTKHYTAVIDGVIHDTFNPSDRGCNVYGEHYFDVPPKGAVQLANGQWSYNQERCVYGYWHKP